MSQQTYGQTTVVVKSTEAENSAQKEGQLRKNMIDGWVSYLITNIILSIIFPNAWWTFIPNLVLFIKAIEKTVAFIEFKNKKPATPIESPIASSVQSNAYSTPAPTNPIISETITPAATESKIHFCAACGAPVDEQTRFCSICGMKIR